MVALTGIERASSRRGWVELSLTCSKYVELVRHLRHSGPYEWLAWSVGGLSRSCAGLLDGPSAANHTGPAPLSRARFRRSLSLLYALPGSGVAVHRHPGGA